MLTFLMPVCVVTTRRGFCVFRHTTARIVFSTSLSKVREIYITSQDAGVEKSDDGGSEISLHLAREHRTIVRRKQVQLTATY